ncbi:putative non-specific serine/threonine protein kinase [Medicago truncatula]|uniref:Putative non-specific serine/threonine protein kinase n=1 Tax=Medicago truncatula TaxID=3880 RepID=A0A396HTX6_MEDTR|nr:putative non-specific serine/threonine protein kinase [Medicago truncatula]
MFKQGLQDEFGTLYTWKDDPNSDCFKWMGVECNNQTGYVQSLDLQGSETNYLSGEINPSITELQHLKYPDPSYLYISSQIPRFILNICTAETFASDNNNLSGDFSDFIIHNNYSYCIGNVSSLQVLSLSNNKISAIIGEIPSSIRSLTKLEMLIMSKNFFKGVITEYHFTNLSKLEYLYLSYNSLTMKVSDDWVPPFQLQELDLSYCNMDSRFPNWLQKQNNLSFMYLSNVGSLPPTPSWFWGKLQTLVSMTISNNNLTGRIPNLEINLTNYPEIDLSSNQLEGAIPSFLLQTAALHLSNSKISDLASFYAKKVSLTFWEGVDQFYKNPDMFLKSIDLSSNHLTGKIPTEIGYLFGLISLNLSRNNLCGEIISNIGNFKSLEFLDLSRNHLSGRIPSSLAHIDRLTWLDLSNNQLYGEIPIGTQLQTFDTSSFDGNFNLCGEPLDRKCHGEDPAEHPVLTIKSGDENSIFLEALYMSMGIGFFTGFIGLVGSILLLPS